MKIAIIAALVGIALTATSAEAQRRCTKGIPCGNTCIAADRVCRIGTSQAPRDPAPGTQPQALIGGGLTAASRDSASFEWIGSVDGAIYYRATCPMAMRLWPEERIRFRAESDAVARGYRRSRVVGC